MMMDVSLPQPVETVVTLAVVWIGLGVAGLAFVRAPRFITHFIFPCGALVALLLAITGLGAIGAPPSVAILPAGLLDLPFHVRVDALSGFFLMLLGGVAFGTSLFSTGYFRGMAPAALALLSLQYHVFLASMTVVLIADDAYLFMVAWEAMALASYFLVTTEHHEEQNRKAGFIYLVVAHIGALGILLCFGVYREAAATIRLTLCVRPGSVTTGPAWRFCWHFWASAPRRACCRCTCGCRKHIRWRLLPFRR